jgi:hypothetical protein
LTREEARQLALSTQQPAAAVAAVREKGVLSGKRVERSEHGQPGEFEALERMSAAELTVLIEASLRTEQPVQDGE